MYDHQVRMHETLIAPSGPRSSALDAATAAAAAAVAAAAVAAASTDADGEVLSHSRDSDMATTSSTEIVPFTTTTAAASPPSPQPTISSSNSSIAATKGTRAVELDDLEILLTERLGSLSANTANRLASIINDG